MKRHAVSLTITNNYLPQARALAKSLKEHNPDCRVIVLIADKKTPASEPLFETIGLEALGDAATIEKMSFYYRPLELCCALRPFMHEYLMNHTDVTSWIQLDSDMLVYHSLAPLWEQLEKSSILLTPHTLTPSQSGTAERLDAFLLKYGVFNGGFLGLSRTETTRSFIQWFKSRLATQCFDDGPGAFLDQSWLTLVPAYFANVGIARNPGANFAFWNFHERTVSKDAQGRFLVNGEPLLILHFSGWDPSNPSLVTRHSPPYEPQYVWSWAELAEDYRRRLEQAGHQSQREAYQFDTFVDGSAICDEARRLYFKSLRSDRPLVGSPFTQPLYFRRLIKESKRRKVIEQAGNLTRRFLRKLS